MGLRLFCLPNFPGAMFIRGATFIPDSRVTQFFLRTKSRLNHGVGVYIRSNLMEEF